MFDIHEYRTEAAQRSYSQVVDLMQDTVVTRRGAYASLKTRLFLREPKLSSKAMTPIFPTMNW